MENNAAINRECWNKRVLIVFVRVDPMFVAGCCCHGYSHSVCCVLSVRFWGCAACF